MLKGTRLYSILFNKCPRCQQGSFFVEDNPYKLKTFSQMKEKCEVCSESFTRETGFYYGAMYASYGLTVIFGIILFLILITLLQLNIWYFLISYSLSVLLLMPVFYRKSRLIWINLFVGPKKKT
ncbi:MAG: hypothetical protein K0S12_2450 [Bacteroidetes bacterium]|nr:hypothetical protein [Bacteroidota bacterium]